MTACEGFYPQKRAGRSVSSPNGLSLSRGIGRRTRVCPNAPCAAEALVHKPGADRCPRAWAKPCRAGEPIAWPRRVRCEVVGESLLISSMLCTAATASAQNVALPPLQFLGGSSVIPSVPTSQWYFSDIGLYGPNCSQCCYDMSVQDLANNTYNASVSYSNNLFTQEVAAIESTNQADGSIER